MGNNDKQWCVVAFYDVPIRKHLTSSSYITGYVCSQYSFRLPLRMNGMHRKQSDHVHLDLLLRHYEWMECIERDLITCIWTFFYVKLAKMYSVGARPFWPFIVLASTSKLSLIIVILLQRQGVFLAKVKFHGKGIRKQNP